MQQNNEEEVYKVRERVAVHDEQITALKDELKRQMGLIRTLELKWYGVVAGLCGTIVFLARMGKWI